MNEILKNIKEKREILGLSQENIAVSIGMTQASFGLIENGKRRLTYHTLQQIAIAFECEVIDIITYPDIYELKDNSKQECEFCKEKDRAIKNLNDYIHLLTKRKKKNDRKNE